MTPFGPDVRRMAIVTALLTLVTFAGVLLVMGAPIDTIGQSLLRGGVAFSVTGAFWAFYNKLGWRLPGFRLWRWLSPCPDLSGRWEGTICRSENDEPHPFVIEVSQTFSSLSFRTFSRNSSGQSIGAWLTRDESGEAWGAVAVWQTTTKHREFPNKDETFPGTSLWNVEITDNPGVFNDHLKIVDKYYTSRHEMTRGRIEVTRVSRKLRNGFAMDGAVE